MYESRKWKRTYNLKWRMYLVIIKCLINHSSIPINTLCHMSSQLNFPSLMQNSTKICGTK
jgi:hypothetical protein